MDHPAVDAGGSRNARRCGKGKTLHRALTRFSGSRWRRFDTRLGTTYLCALDLGNVDYLPFFVVERLAKALGIEGMPAPLLVYTGDPQLYRELAGYVRVIKVFEECVPYAV